MCLMPGNNVYGEAVRDELLKMKNSPERASYILMKRVHPVVYRNYPITPHRPVELVEMVSELGIFGCLLAYVLLISFVIVFTITDHVQCHCFINLWKLKGLLSTERC